MDSLLSGMGSPKTLAAGIGLALVLFALGLLCQGSPQVVQYINLALKLLVLFNLVVCLVILVPAGKTRQRKLDAFSHILRNFDDHHAKQN